MRSFATVAILTALVGLLLGAALAAADPNLGRGGSIALAAGESVDEGVFGGLMKMVGQPLLRAFNLNAPPVVKVDMGTGEKNAPKNDTGKPDRSGNLGIGGGKR